MLLSTSRPSPSGWTSRQSCKQSVTLTGLTLNGKCIWSFAGEKYAIDASMRAQSNGRHKPNKWFGIVRGMIMFSARLVTRFCRLTAAGRASIDPLSTNLVSLNC